MGGLTRGHHHCGHSADCYRHFHHDDDGDGDNNGVDYNVILDNIDDDVDVLGKAGRVLVGRLPLSSFASNGLVLPPLCSSLSTNHLFLFCQSSSFLISNKEMS